MNIDEEILDWAWDSVLKEKRLLPVQDDVDVYGVVGTVIADKQTHGFPTGCALPAASERRDKPLSLGLKQE